MWPPQAPAAARDHCLRLLGKRARTALDYEAAAQALRAGLGEEQFVEALKTRLAEPPRNEKIEDRLRWLRGIPFRAVLTTNFDGLLSGVTPGRDAYLSVLRAQDHRWWDGRYWDGLRPGPQVVKLHGDLSTRPPAHLRHRPPRLPPAPLRKPRLPDVPPGRLLHDHRPVHRLLLHRRLP